MERRGNMIFSYVGISMMLISKIYIKHKQYKQCYITKRESFNGEFERITLTDEIHDTIYMSMLFDCIYALMDYKFPSNKYTYK